MTPTSRQIFDLAGAEVHFRSRLRRPPARFEDRDTSVGIRSLGVCVSRPNRLSVQYTRVRKASYATQNVVTTIRLNQTYVRIYSRPDTRYPAPTTAAGFMLGGDVARFRHAQTPAS